MTQQSSLGIVHHDTSDRRTDYLYRISIKSLIRNPKGEILVVKEVGRDWWDLPGGGMDHHENIQAAIAREMYEEVTLTGDFTYRIIAVEDPVYLAAHDFWQLRLIFEVTPENMHFQAGEDGDEVAFMDPAVFKESERKTERRIFEYAVQ
ncbi:MAG TPA: NUDIX hydrolase [Candidatus Saccharimonadales bacterium]|nr:NUDIX hydrolase [Candidatus Saccharimonadales bacterium]